MICIGCGERKRELGLKASERLGQGKLGLTKHERVIIHNMNQKGDFITLHGRERMKIKTHKEKKKHNSIGNATINS